jgi:hypothetical protein
MSNEQNGAAPISTQSPEALAEEIRMAFENEDSLTGAMLVGRGLLALESIAASLAKIAKQGEPAVLFKTAP